MSDTKFLEMPRGLKESEDSKFYWLASAGAAERDNSAKPVLERIRVDFMPYGAPLETSCNPTDALCVMQPLLRKPEAGHKSAGPKCQSRKSSWIRHDAP